MSGLFSPTFCSRTLAPTRLTPSGPFHPESTALSSGSVVTSPFVTQVRDTSLRRPPHPQILPPEHKMPLPWTSPGGLVLFSVLHLVPTRNGLLTPGTDLILLGPQLIPPHLSPSHPPVHPSTPPSIH